MYGNYNGMLGRNYQYDNTNTRLQPTHTMIITKTISTCLRMAFTYYLQTSENTSSSTV